MAKFNKNGQKRSFLNVFGVFWTENVETKHVFEIEMLKTPPETILIAFLLTNFSKISTKMLKIFLGGFGTANVEKWKPKICHFTPPL